MEILGEEPTMRTLAMRLIWLTAMSVLTGCASMLPPAQISPDGAKQFVLTMRAGDFSPRYLVVNQGDRVRLLLYSDYQFAFFTFNHFGIHRLVSHDAPEVVQFVATERGWFDFSAHAFYPYSAHLHLVPIGAGATASPEHILYGRLYVL